MRPLFKYGISICCAAIVLAQSASAAQGVVNANKKTWQVRYHKDNANRRGDVGLRLKVKEAAGGAATGEIEATLVRYDRTNPAGNKYKRWNDAKIELKGRIIANKGQGNTTRKREEFVLIGTFYEVKANGKLDPHLIVVQGYFSTGRDLASETDNQLVVRLTDKKINVNASDWMMPGFLYGLLVDPCDDLPPDEDVMSEEDIGNNSDDVGDEANDPGYDGGA